MNNKKLKLSNNSIAGIVDFEKLEKMEKLEYFDCSNNKITQIINIPYSLKYLNCSNNEIISLEQLPNNIITINCKNNPLKTLHYPINIKPNKYPSKLKKIIFGENFDQPIDNLPKILNEIIFTQYSKFNQPINFLPNSLEILILGNSFNNSLDNLPNSLKYLTIGNTCSKYFNASCIFNQSLDNLPNSLIELTFCNESIFQKSLDNLPNTLKKITLSGYYTGSIDNLSDSIETIMIGPTWLKYNDNTYGALFFKKKINKLPKSLKKLCIINNDIYKNYKELNFDDLKLLNDELSKNFNNPYSLKYYLNFCGFDIKLLF